MSIRGYSNIMGFLSSIISSIGSALGITKKPTQLGSVIVKPSEVSSVSKGTPYSVPATGVSGIGGGSSSQTSKPITDTRSLVPQGNIEEAIASQTGGGQIQLGTTTTPKMATQATYNPETTTRKGNTLTDAELAKIPINQRPKAINSLTGQEMLAPQVTTEEASPTSAYTLQQAGTAIGAAVGGTALNAIVSNASSLLLGLQNYFTSIGATAKTAAGAKSIAATSKEAAGIASKSGVGEVAVNTATKATGIKALTNILANNKLLTVGAIISMGWQTGSGQTQVRKDISSYIKDSGDLAVKLRQVGMTAEADELYQNGVDLLDGLDAIVPYIPLIGKVFEENKIQEYRDELNRVNNLYEEQLELEAKQAALDERAYKEQQLQEQRAYEERLLAERRAYEQQLLEEQRAYEEEQAAKEREADAAAAFAAEATATEGTGGSTLNFGILNSGGDIEYVDINKASQFYYGKAFEELT